MRPSSKILSRDRECCQQLQLPGQFPRIKVFESNPNTLHNGNQSEEFECINVYPPDQKSNPSRKNTFGKWHSFKKIAEIKDDKDENIIGYKQEYDFVDPQGKKNGLKMREYTRYKRGENNNSYCVIYKKKKYNYLSTSEEKGRDMERQPNEEHRSSLAPTPLQALSQTSNRGSTTLNVLDGRLLHDLMEMEKFLLTEDSEFHVDQNSSSNIELHSSPYNQFSSLL